MINQENYKKQLLNKRFESYFAESYISNQFNIKPKEITINKEITYSWDYGIYDDNNKLVMVIDIESNSDKDNCDENKFLSVPENIKYHIIYEHEWKNSFELMIKNIMLDYNKFILNQFILCRTMPFPIPKYTVSGLLTSYDQLIRLKTNDKHHASISLRNREGDRIINHFHPSIWDANVKGELSPHDAWYHDDLLLRVIKNRIIYVNVINPNKILQGFNICKVAPKVSVFSAGRAKLLINRYLNEFNTIFDPFSGFSGRMLGAISLNKNYIGQDISEIHIRESNNIINFLKEYYNNLPLISLEVKDIMNSSGEYECLFTCSPYNNKEEWCEVNTINKSCDEWIDECLNRFKCKKYLFVVDSTIKYRDNIVDAVSNKSHFSKNKELIILI